MPSDRRPGGLAAALEQERLELASDFRNSSTPHHAAAHQGPSRRSVLDTATGPSPGSIAPRHGSIAGIGVGVTPPAGRGYQDSPHPAPPAPNDANNESPSSSTSSSPSTTPVTTPKTPYTSLKTAPPPIKRPDPPPPNDKEKNGDNKASPETRRLSIRWDSGVDMPPSANNSKRHSQPQEKAPRALPGRNAMAAVMSGFDLKVPLPSFSRGRDSSRSGSKRGASLDSHLPSSGRRAQSGSPARRLPNSSLRSPVSDTPKSPTPAEKPKEPKSEVIDEKLLHPHHSRSGSSETDARASVSGDERLYDSDNNASDSSEAEESSTTDEEGDSENNSEDTKRGRKKLADRRSSNGSKTAKTTSGETGT